MMPGPWLPERARRCADHPAVVWQGRVLSYAALGRRARGRAEALHRLGVAAGEPVALLCANGPEFVEWVHALDRLGAVLLPLNWRLTPRELAHQLRHARVRTLLHDRGHAALAQAACRDLPQLRLVAVEQASDPGDDAGRVAPRALAEPFATLFTSGTTGRPKAALLTRGAFLWSALASALHLGVRAGDRWLACMPLFHVGGLSIVLRSVLQGTTLVLHERFDAERVSRDLDRAGISVVSLTATMLQRLLRARAGRRAPETLRLVLLGGGPCPAPVLDEARAAGFPVAPSYGLTEACSQVATRPPERGSASGLTPLPGTALCIADERDRPLPAGQVGEILVRGPTLMRGYLHDPEATRQALRGGWLHTGDLGRTDAAGDLHVVDRRSDLIVSGGENVYPAEVEACLLEHPDVAEAGVGGVDDAEFGRRPVAWWVPRPGARCDAPALRGFCRERLAGYKVPVAFHCVEALPRDANGKLLRAKLAAPEGGAPRSP